MSTHTQHTTHHAVDPQKEALTYKLVLGTLLFLTIVTVGASYVNFGSSTVNVVIALTIATIKASVVALFFMHLLHEKPINGVIATAGFLFLGIFLMFCVIDIGARRDPLPRNVKAPVAVAAPAAAAEGTPAPAADKRE